MKNIELEYKFEIKEDQVEELRQRLFDKFRTRLGVFEYESIDTYFTSLDTDSFFRIRQTNDLTKPSKLELTYKQWGIYESPAIKEINLPVSFKNYDATVELVNSMGYLETFALIKSEFVITTDKFALSIYKVTNIDYATQEDDPRNVKWFFEIELKEVDNIKEGVYDLNAAISRLDLDYIKVENKEDRRLCDIYKEILSNV